MAKPGPKGPNKPMTDEDWEKLIGMIEIQCTRDEICNIFGMGETTLNKRIKEKGEDNFQALYKKYSDVGKRSLRRMQWKSAQEGSVPMQIFLGKQNLGQADKVEEKSEQTINYVSEEPLTPEEWANQYGKGVQDEQESVH